MKEFIGGMAAAFGIVAAYNIITNNKKKVHENRIDELLSKEHEDNNSNEKFPATAYESADNNGFYYGRNAISGNDILFDRKHSRLPSGLIIGSAGSGKSWAAAHEIAQVLDNTDDNVIIIEKEGFYSYDERISDRVTSVSPYDSNSEYHINPLDVYITECTDRNEHETITNIVERAISLIEEILDKALYNAEKCVVADAVNNIFEPFLQHLHNSNTKCDYKLNPSLSDVVEYIFALADNSDSAEISAEIIALSTELRREEALINKYFSFKTNMPHDRARAVVLTWKDTPHFLHAALYAGCVMYSWNRLLQNREVQKYSWIYLEDFDSLLNKKTESVLALVFELFKRSRPYGGIVTLIAQSVEELKKTETGNACFVSAGFIRCMSCKCQDRNTISKVFGLHDDILEYISSAPVGSGLLIAPELVIPFVGN